MFHHCFQHSPTDHLSTAIAIDTKSRAAGPAAGVLYLLVGRVSLLNLPLQADGLLLLLSAPVPSTDNLTLDRTADFHDPRLLFASAAECLPTSPPTRRVLPPFPSSYSATTGRIIDPAFWSRQALTITVSIRLVEAAAASQITLA